MRLLSDFGWFANAMLHGLGWGCALRIEAHFDESGTDANELTLAGYLFEAERIDSFGSEWNALLDHYDLPYFHMVDCAHGNPPFDKLKKRDHIRVQMQLMRLIKRYSINGIVCNIPNTKDNDGKSYLKAVEGAVGVALDWAGRVAFEGKIAYFLEAGAKGEGLVDSHFGQIAKDPAKASAHRYAGHAFLPKAGNPGVQAADLLAWQYHNYTKKRAKNDLARLDLRALLRHPHLIGDECGDPPRESKLQSASESRDRIETVYYLPIDKENKAESVLVAGKDITMFTGATKGSILACSNCYRALAEDMSLNQFKNLAIQCWCGTKALIPDVMVPFVRRF